LDPFLPKTVPGFSTLRFTAEEDERRMHVKGGLLRARFLFVVLNHGPDTWARVLAALPDEERESLKEIVVDNWYPLSTLDVVDRAIAELLNPGGGSKPKA